MTETKATKTVKKTTKTASKATKKSVVFLNAENAGFKAGDVYQVLASEGRALEVKEIAALAKISVEDAYLGIGWLFKEFKIVGVDDNKVALA